AGTPSRIAGRPRASAVRVDGSAAAGSRPRGGGPVPGGLLLPVRQEQHLLREPHPRFLGLRLLGQVDRVRTVARSGGVLLSAPLPLSPRGGLQDGGSFAGDRLPAAGGARAAQSG